MLVYVLSVFSAAGRSRTQKLHVTHLELTYLETRTLLGTSATLLVTSALLVVTKSY